MRKTMIFASNCATRTQMSKSNVEQSQKRATRLENAGAFRVLEKHMMGFRRRAGQQNWSKELHTVKEARYGHVYDTDGNGYPISIVLPASARTADVAAPPLAKGGSLKTDEKRRIALRPWLEPLLGHIRRAGDEGLSIHPEGKLMAAQAGFTQALRERRATLAHMKVFWPRRSATASCGHVRRVHRVNAFSRRVKRSPERKKGSHGEIGRAHV